MATFRDKSRDKFNMPCGCCIVRAHDACELKSTLVSGRKGTVLSLVICIAAKNTKVSGHSARGIDVNTMPDHAYHWCGCPNSENWRGNPFLSGPMPTIFSECCVCVHVSSVGKSHLQPGTEYRL